MGHEATPPNECPTEQTLQTIRDWRVFATGLEPLLRFVQSKWTWPNHAFEQRGLWIFTPGGWQGNEDLWNTLELTSWRELALRVIDFANFKGEHHVIATTDAAADALEIAHEAFCHKMMAYVDVLYPCPRTYPYPDKIGGNKK